MIYPTAAHVIAMGAVVPTFDILFVALRFFAKRRRITRYGIDDYLILWAMLFACACGAILITGAVTAGFGQRSPVVSSDNGINTENDMILIKTKRLTDFFNFFQPWSLGPAKLSVIFFYRSIFRGKTFNIMSWSLIGLVISWMLAGFFLFLLQCGGTIPNLWTSAKSVAALCLSGEKIEIFYATTDVITDIMILSMPLYWTSKLHMTLVKRLLVCVIFLFGAITVLAGIARLIIYSIIFPSHNSNPNQLGYATSVAYWSMLEVGLAIIAACLPTLGPLLSEKSRTHLSQLVSRFLSLHSRESNQKHTHLRSVSETHFVPKVGGPADHLGVESIVMGDVDRHVSEPEGQIIVTHGTSRHSSIVRSEV